MSDSITVVGNLSIDRVDGGPPTPGGCPAFAGAALRATGEAGRIVTRLAPADRGLFAAVLDRTASDRDVIAAVTVLPAVRTSAFDLRYEGEHRTLIVRAIGDSWTMADIEAAQIDTGWVHVAPLLRDEFPPDTLAALAGTGRRVCYDGQGLVRPRVPGPVHPDGAYDPVVLQHISVLKLSSSEAQAVACGPFDAAAARRLGVPEIVVTQGSGGCDLYVDGKQIHVGAQPVPNVNATGAGDVFMVAYAARRAAGASPRAAAECASVAVTTVLNARKQAGDA